MKPIAVLESRQGGQASIAYYSGEIKSLAPRAKIDAYIVSTEDGFSPLGSNRRFLSADLGVPEKEIRHLADWNRFKNSRVTLVAIPSRRDGGYLRGVILAASESSECYERFAVPRYGRPYRDFYYNVAYEPSPTHRMHGARSALLFLTFPGAIAFMRTSLPAMPKHSPIITTHTSIASNLSPF